MEILEEYVLYAMKMDDIRKLVGLQKHTYIPNRFTVFVSWKLMKYAINHRSASATQCSVDLARKLGSSVHNYSIPV